MSLLEQVKEAGVVGAGGAGFPTYAKLNCKAEYILMNGAECEPLLRVDQQLMAMYPDEIIQGFKAAGELVGAQKAIIGIKGKHHDVIEILAVSLIGAVPDDENIVIAANQGEPLVGNDTLAGQAYMNIVRRVMGEEVPFLDLDSGSGFFSRLLKRLGVK